ncbi:MAG: lipoprotein-releasing ABC transporter permease subunit [Desulfovibrio sp.]|uniref:lipoprotein-releasing ABC transporter permease subunit n=1 Tax=Desulfovibrio sp. 7SRBS1 TaxID=3378064 RepID=UPI003B3FBD98
MKFELFVAFRYLLALRKQAFISVISLFAILGVCLGVASLIVVIGVMNGFSHDLRDKIVGVNAHVIVSSFSSPLRDYQEIEKQALAVPGVVGATPFVYSEVMLSTPRGVKGLVLRGIDPTTAGNVLSLAKDMQKGSLQSLAEAKPLPGIIVGSELAKRLGLFVGARVNLLSPAGKKTSAGFVPTVKIFRVVGIFRTGMYEYDSSLGYVSVASAQKLIGLAADQVTGVELRLDNIDHAEPITLELRKVLSGRPLYVRNWMEMNTNLFAAMKLEKTAMFIILVMIVLVGSFSIVTTLVMLVMKKRRDISILMSLGATKERIQRIFLLQGTIIGGLGTLLGYAVGIPLSLLLEKYQFIQLPKNVYPVDTLPVLLDPLDLTMIGVCAFMLCFLTTLYPARKASQLDPVEALRYE